MEFKSRYQAHEPDENGYVHYEKEEHKVWQLLFEEQEKIIHNRAADEFLQGIKILKFKAYEIPQLVTINAILTNLTGWQVVPVKALISAREFFTLLSNRKFPAATFIRHVDELKYVKEPDIFHELFGHCPMLTNKVFADFVHDYACMVLKLPEKDWPLLQRFFWFTVEFGLIQTKKGLKSYGGGILSSNSETVYAVESHIPLRALFDPLAIFRTPYRIDNLQPIYFVINNYAELYDVSNLDLVKLIVTARTLGEFPPLFETEAGNPNIHIHAC